MWTSLFFLNSALLFPSVATLRQAAMEASSCLVATASQFANLALSLALSSYNSSFITSVYICLDDFD